MVEVINSSFIPKNEFKKEVNKRKSPRVNIFFLIALTIFLTSIVASVGVYLYKNSLEKENERLKAVFEQSEADWGLDSIREFSRINKKIKFSRELLKNHYNLIPIFTYLENKTLQDVVLRNFSLMETDKYINIKASGHAPALTDLQLQSKSYAENLNVSDLVMYNITKDDKGNSIFDLSFSVHKKYLTERAL